MSFDKLKKEEGNMKYKDITTEEDKQNRIMRIEMTAENWEENKLLAKGMGIDLDTPRYVQCNFDLKKEEIYE